MLLVYDGGFISWAYGSDKKRWVAFHSAAARIARGWVAIDSFATYRSQLMPSYKAHRAIKDKHPDVRMLVRQFVNDELKPNVPTLQLDGFEADDIIAALHYFRNCRVVVGEDKDLLQLPGLTLTKLDLMGSRTIYDFVSKMPIKLQPYIRRPRDVLFALCIFGDTSDNIPRILPKRDYDTFNHLLKEPHPFTAASEEWGPQVGINLWLTVLPSPFSFAELATPDDLLCLVDNAEWWLDTSRLPYAALQTQVLERVDERIHV